MLRNATTASAGTRDSSTCYLLLSSHQLLKQLETTNGMNCVLPDIWGLHWREGGCGTCSVHPPTATGGPGSDHPARGRSCRAAPLLLKTHACPRGFWAPPTHCCPAPHPSSRVSVIKRSEEALANTEWGGGWTSHTKYRTCSDNY